ncbi:hypothetical protein C6503_01355 [Candidatus Poribacteria bacterium]|nr:MAG: hypothetical protein C6503_01355 [Candidatus Poribacteria bacterium]
MNVKRTRTYVILGMALLLSISLFANSGWADERDVLSFVSVEDRTRPIILMDTQGKILQELVIPGLTQLSLSWAPDGRSFTYHAIHNQVPNLDFDIYVMDMETQTSRRLTLDEGLDIWPAWSPNGKWISFASNRAGTYDLYRVDVDGGNLIKLTDGHNYDKTAWSPDSQSIAFTSRASLFVMTAEGRKLRQLAGNAHGVDCTWSPDGKKIAFSANNGIFSIDVNGRNLRQLTQLNQSAWFLAWSPSGEWIAYRLTDILGDLVIGVVNTVDSKRGGVLEATRGLKPNYLDWVPEGFLSVFPSVEKQITFWGALKQNEHTSQ